jgi:hypothetical protein
VSAIKDYCELFRIDDLQLRDALFRNVKTLDAAWLAHVTKDSTLKSEKNAS